MKKLSSNKGFTLVELIIVIAILAIIMLIAIPNMSGIRHQMQVNSDKIEAAEIGKAVRMWYTTVQTDTATQNVVNKTALDAEGDPNPLVADAEGATVKLIPEGLAVTGLTYLADLPADGAMAHLCQLPKLEGYVETTETPESIVDATGVTVANQYYFVGKTGSGTSEKIVVAIATAAPELDDAKVLTKADVLFDGKPLGDNNNSIAYVEQ